MSLTIESSRFGRVEIDPETVVAFPDGLIGLGGSRYALRAARKRARQPVPVAAFDR